MVAKLHLRHDTPHRRRMPPLNAWQRRLLGGVFLVAVTLSAALIFFQPGARTLIYLETPRPIPLADAAPALPPGTDSYYHWGQWKPLDQQP